ncbi:VRR-NUC domain-containing protein [Acinetobacter indicus]|uniref:VRR-NUC domain-containing protein n=1 Tax=Acinetobacter indicus TaxID=756892 RepID=UPI00209B722A|nr:VRR-NUC domain-containing protein [Acinetobacter indicus]MCO8088205.1 VRR-NUC domain-containing protein [Acinetobacter indicus]
MRKSRRWNTKDLTAKRQPAGSSRMTAAKYARSTIEETDIQQALIEELGFYKYQGKPLLDYIYAIPNGGHRSISVAKRLKAEGVKPGVPDLHCFIACPPYHSLYIEMKTERGTLSDHQNEVIPLLREQGHKVVVCRSQAQAKTELFKYLGISQ